MRKVSTIVIAICIFVTLGVTAYAEPSVTITDITPTAEELPTSTETHTENGVVIIEKTFEVTPGVDPQTFTQPFEQNGYNFVYRETLRREATSGTSARLTSKTAAIITDTDDIAEVIALFADTTHYEQDGYTGRLRIDSTSLVIEADEYETFTYPFTRTRDIPGLSRNDPALVEREWNGLTLYGLTFRQGADGRYTATATYRGLATGRRAVSFIATVNYYGEVARAAQGSTLYTIAFAGTPIEAPEQPSTTAEAPAIPADGGINLLPIVIVVLALAGSGAAFYKLKLKRGNTNHETINKTKRFMRAD